MATDVNYVLSAKDETAAAFNSFNNKLKEVAKNSDTVAKASKVGFALFVGGELLGGLRALGKEMFNVANAANKIDGQRLQSMNDSMSKAKASFLNVAAIIGSKLAPILETVANWFVKLIGNGDGFREKFGAVFAALTRAVGVFADGWRGIEVIWEVLTVAFHGFRLAVITGMQGIDTVIVDIANKLPGVQLQYSQSLGTMAKSASESVDQAKERLHNLMMKPLPSAMMMDAVRQFDTMTGVAIKATKEQEKARDAAAKALAKAKEAQDKEQDDLLDSAFDKVQKEEQALQAGLESLRKSGQSKLQTLQDQHNAELATIQSARMRNLESEEGANQLELESKARFNEQKAALQKEGDDKSAAARVKELGEFAWFEQTKLGLEQKGWKAKLSGIQGMLGFASSLMQSNRRKEFEVGKAAAIANATISMFEGIGKAWSYGPILGPIFATLVGAAGLMNIRSIKSQQFGGGGAANVGAVPTMSVGETGLPSRSSQVAEAPMLPASSSSSAPARNVTVIVQSDSGMVSTDWLVNQLGPTLKEAYGDGHFEFMRA